MGETFEFYFVVLLLRSFRVMFRDLENGADAIRMQHKQKGSVRQSVAVFGEASLTRWAGLLSWSCGCGYRGRDGIKTVAACKPRRLQHLVQHGPK